MSARPNLDVPPLRLAVVPYLNVQPMIYGLAEAYPQLRLIPAAPRALDSMLAAGEADLGTAPVFTALSRPEMGILRGPVIASPGPVRSVLLVAREPWERVRRVWRDPVSVTSNALTALLDREWWKEALEFIESPTGASDGPEALPDATGRIMIGDRALLHGPSYPFARDLASEWRAWTGLPFVFAALVGRAGVRTGQLAEALEENCERNLARLEETAAAYSGLPSLGLEERVCYLRDNLSHRLGPAEQAAVERFAAELQSIGMIPQGQSVRWIVR